MLRPTLWNSEPVERSSRHLANGKDRCWGIAVIPGANDMVSCSPLSRQSPAPLLGSELWGRPACSGKEAPRAPVMQCSQDFLKGLPGMSAFWGRGSSTASVINHIPAASWIQIVLTGTGSSVRLPGVSLRTWRGYWSTCAPPASTSPTQSTQVGLPFAEPHVLGCAG